jgi:hypothetical protein
MHQPIEIQQGVRSWNEVVDLAILGHRDSLRDPEISRRGNKLDSRTKPPKRADGPGHVHG